MTGSSLAGTAWIWVATARLRGTDAVADLDARQVTAIGSDPPLPGGDEELRLSSLGLASEPAGCQRRRCWRWSDD